MQETSLIVIGTLNTDIIVAGLDQFPRPNDPVYGGKFSIGPGGKSANIASMAGALAPTGTVAMIGRTAEDEYSLWKQPINGLQKNGVNTDFIKVIKSGETDLQPSIALVTVDKQGNNMCFIASGMSQEFDEADIDAAAPLFDATAKNGGIFALSLECPISTAKHAIRKAVDLGIKVAFDPGGVVEGMDITELINEKPYLLKPNEYEAKIITGIEITDFGTAAQAAQKLKQMGAQNVMITHGEHGAYLFGDEEPIHMPVPILPASTVKDATGCGDQTMATLCVYLQAGKSLREAAEAAVLAGTLQFQKLGIQPVTAQEMKARL